jgi:16S rRNA U516 pseudouridylate synthase RsuA-like enzyme
MQMDGRTRHHARYPCGPASPEYIRIVATAPVQLDEAELIKEQIAQIELPEGLRSKAIKPMTESTGEPVWRLTFSASTKIPLTKDRLAELRQVRKALDKRIFALRLDRWVFTRFVEGR